MEYKISILGAGNVAWHLAPALEDAGHTIMEVYSRSIRAAQKLTDRLYTAEAVDDMDFSTSQANVFILAVKDTAIPTVVDEVILPENSILLHTSGTVSLDILNHSSASHTGILYPLQSFSKGRKLDFNDVPFLIESEEEETLEVIRAIAKSLSPQVYHVNSKDRKVLHVAGVFASNFSNHMIRISEDIMRRQGLDFEMMKPLIIETIAKSLEIGAQAAQTGPAKREDYSTLEDHHNFLSYDEDIAEIYRLISQHIIDSD